MDIHDQDPEPHTRNRGALRRDGGPGGREKVLYQHQHYSPTEAMPDECLTLRGVAGALCGGMAASALSAQPAAMVGCTAFGASALLYMVTPETLNAKS